MCRLYGFRANEATKVECTLVHAQNALMVQSRGDLAGQTHANGWGVATYEDHRPRIEHEAWAAYSGEQFRRAAETIYSTTVLAHVRRATVGPSTIENTHPFEHGRWSFAHNGTIPKFAVVQSRLLEAMAPEHRRAIRGQTDSEHVFHFLLSIREREPSMPIVECVRAGIHQIVGWCREADPQAAIGLNIMLTDGEELVGARHGRTLFYVERHGVYDCEICGFPHIHHDPATPYRAVVVASEPITHERWREMPDRSLFHVDGEVRFRIESLDPATEPASHPAAATKI